MLKSNRSLVKCHEMTSSNSKDRRSWWTRNTFKFTKSATLQQCRWHASIEQLRFLSAQVWQWPSSIYTLYSLFPPYEHGTRRAPWLEGLPSAILQGLCFVSPYRPDKAANNRWTKWLAKSTIAIHKAPSKTYRHDGWTVECLDLEINICRRHISAIARLPCGASARLLRCQEWHQTCIL